MRADSEARHKSRHEHKYEADMERLEGLETHDKGRKLIGSAKDLIASAKDATNKALGLATKEKSKSGCHPFFPRSTRSGIKIAEKCDELIKFEEERTSIRAAEAASNVQNGARRANSCGASYGLP